MRAALLCTALFLLAVPLSEAQQTSEILSDPLAAPHESGMTTAVEAISTVQVIGETNPRVVESREVPSEPATEIGAQVSARNMFTIIGVVVVVVALIALFT